jgi:NET1-associated nuclear protein 1 (U3 small nucleolar RNA-associated protein 17)
MCKMKKYKNALKQREKLSKNPVHNSSNKSTANPTPNKAKDLWKLSEPIGGRMINADPVFSTDEKYVRRS